MKSIRRRILFLFYFWNSNFSTDFLHGRFYSAEINISTENNKLVIEGERKEEKKEDDKEKKCHFMERHFGSFHREVALPKNTNVENIGAVYENGVLKVNIPKIEVTSGKKTVTVN